MGKSTIKRQKFNVIAVNKLSEKYKVTERFVRMSIVGDRKSDRSEDIKKEYPKMVRKINKLLRKV